VEPQITPALSRSVYHVLALRRMTRPLGHSSDFGRRGPDVRLEEAPRERASLWLSLPRSGHEARSRGRHQGLYGPGCEESGRFVVDHRGWGVGSASLWKFFPITGASFFEVSRKTAQNRAILWTDKPASISRSRSVPDGV
jgi:hypothetical protein